MKSFILLLLLIVFVPPVSAQQTALIANTDGRKTISLDGQWQTIVDPYESGYYDYRYQPSPNGYFKNSKPKSKSDLIEYDFDSSGSLKVPGDWNTQSDQFFFYEGTIWYKKSFDYQRRPNTRLFVYFGAANYIADVYLNGEKLGRHEGGFTPFNFEISSLVRDTGNFLIVKVDNKRRRDAVPTLITDWWNYGGLTRDVKLVETPTTFLQDYFIQLEKGSREHVTGWVKLSGGKLNQKVTIRIPEARVIKSFTTDSRGFAAIDFNADLKLWSPEDPKLYDVAIEAETDQIHDQIGFRSIETRGTEILLNGRPIFLRGVCIHEEAPLRGGRAFSREDARTLLGWAKELGANFVRLAHYPHNEYMIREADRMGIMVWSEIPVYWTILWENSATLDNAGNQLSEMITRDKNRAAVVIWSMANETPLSDARLSFLKNLISHARSLDPTRLISAAMERHYINDTTLTIDDPLGEYLDVLGCNEYVGWYDGLPEKADRLEWKSKYQKPLIMSEFGGDALFGNHGDALMRWTEEYQENLYQHQLAMLKRIPFLRGTSPWILMDFHSPRRPLPKIQDYWNRKGLISNRGEKKKAFYVMQQWYRELEQRQDSSSWVLAWSDEFNARNGSGIDATKWTAEVGGNGWGNNELEYYTARRSNAYQSDGRLVIKAIKEKFSGADNVSRDYTSARLITRNKFSATYGRFEARIKLPKGQGIWPAFWLLGNDIGVVGWPECGEIDIMENIGREPSTIHGTIHGPGYSKGNPLSSSYALPGNRRFADSFHTFAVEWEPNAIRFYCDGILYSTRTPADVPAGKKWVFDKPFFILLNVAVGGDWPGSPDETTVFPQTMLVDYVRVYRRANAKN